MTFKRMVLGAVSASGILLAVPAIAPATLFMASEAQADTSISVNFGFGSFYDRLEPYGNWVSYQDQYVFLPHHVDHGWRPYTLGHWSYTRRYGWLWVSNERFGWATYHYGRWGYSSDIGWYWVPGRRWAPAWVAWSRGQDEVAWAPLPPRSGDDLDISITIGDVPDYYWQAVPMSAFLSINLSDRMIRDRDQVRTFVQQRPPETVHVENNIVINNVIQVNDIEKATNAKVPVLAEKPVNTPDAVAKTDPNSVAIFNPDVKVDAGAKPKKPLKVEQVITERKARGIQPELAPSDQPVVPGQTLDMNAPPVAPAVQPEAKVQVPANGKATTDMPVIKQDKTAIDPLKPADSGTPKIGAQGKVNANKSKDVQPAIIQPPVVVTPGKPKQDKAIINPPVGTDNGVPIVPGDKFNKKKGGDAMTPLNTQKNIQPQQTGQPPKDQNGNGKKPVNGQGKVACDPNIETCPPAQ